MSGDKYVIGFGSNYFRLFGECEEYNVPHENNRECCNLKVVIPNILPPNLMKEEKNLEEEISKKEIESLLHATSGISQIEVGATSITVLRDDCDGSNENAIYSIGTLFGCTHKVPTPLPTRLPLKCTKIAAGRRHVLALMEGGQIVMSWGSDHFGQLGHGSNATVIDTPKIIKGLLPMYVGGHVSDIAAGGLHSAAIVSLAATVQQVFTWGFNNKNQCGMESGKSNYEPYPQPVHGLPPPGACTYRKLALGKLHSVALTNSGVVYSWGSTTFGRCGYPLRSGIGKQKFISLPKKVEGSLANEVVNDIASGAKHTLALTESKKVYSWGCGEDGQLGHGVAIKKIDYPKRIIDLDFTNTDKHSKNTYIQSVHAGGNYSAALTNSNDLYTWGYGNAGQLGHVPDTTDSSLLPIIESTLSSTFEDQIGDSKAFLSDYNALLPKRLKCVRDAGLGVNAVSCGPSNLILICSKDDEHNQKTSFKR